MGTSSRLLNYEHFLRTRSTKMKCFIALALLAVAALSYAEEAVYDIVETREKCHPTGMKPLCKRVVETEYEEVVTREMCPPLLSGGSGCKRISQEKRGCRPGPGKPYCS